MIVVCKKCGKEFDDTELKCPNCGEAYVIENEIEDIIEVPNDEVKPLDDVKFSETPPIVSLETAAVTSEEQPVTLEENKVQEQAVSEEKESTETVENNIDTASEEKTEPVVQEEPTVINEETIQPETLPDEKVEAVVQAEDPGLEAPKLDDILPTDALNNINEISVVNADLETVSVENIEETLEEKEDVFEIPEMPNPEVGEVNLESLINKYDSEEQANLEKQEAKKQYEEALNEQKRLEEEAKKAQPVPKPDLLATIPDETEIDNIIEPVKKKGKKPMRKVMNIIIILLVVAIIGVLIWYFISGQKPKENNNYMEPVKNYFEAYKNNDSTNMLKAFVPCVSQTDEITTLITTTVGNNAQYGVITLEFKEERTEVVNLDDQKYLDTYLSTMCPTDTPKIEEYKHVFVEQKIKGQADKEFTINKPQFWVVKINNEWFILQMQ